MYTTEDTHHFPAYGVAPDYWAQRALGSNHGPPLALAPNFATERLLASESLLREREQATAHAERRNASREKQLSDHTVKLEEHRGQLEAAHASLLSQQAAQRAKAVELRRWEAGLLQREENLKLLLSSPPQGGLTDRQPDEASLQVSLDRRLGARAAADGARSPPPPPPPQQQRPPLQRPMPPQAQVHEQRSRLQSLKSRGPPPQVAAGAASPFFVRTPRAAAADTAAQGASPLQEAAGQEAAGQEAAEAAEAAAAARSEAEERARAAAEGARREASVRASVEAEERAREASVSHAGVPQAEAGVERSAPPAERGAPPPPAAATEGPPSGRPRSRQLPQAKASYALEGDEGVGPVEDVGMVRCSLCSRSFAEDRIEAHERACQVQSAATNPNSNPTPTPAPTPTPTPTPTPNPNRVPGAVRRQAAPGLRLGQGQARPHRRGGRRRPGSGTGAQGPAAQGAGERRRRGSSLAVGEREPEGRHEVQPRAGRRGEGGPRHLDAAAAAQAGARRPRGVPPLRPQVQGGRGGATHTQVQLQTKVRRPWRERDPKS